MMMKFRPGDRVKFMDEAGGGIVTRLDQKGWVYVETEDGFEIPVAPEKLLRTEGFAEETSSDIEERDSQPKPANEPPQEHPEPPAPEQENLDKKLPPLAGEPEIFLSLIPAQSGFDAYLVNDSGYQLFYTYGISEDMYLRISSRELLEENMKVELGRVVPGKGKNLHVQALLFASRQFLPRPALDKIINLDPEAMPLSETPAGNPYFDEDAILVSLLPEKVNTDIPVKKKILREKQDIPPKKLMLRPQISGNVPVEEVDLHIEAIIDDYKDLTPGEILELQLARFETALEGARRSGQKKIVFIHGLGQGKLKFEIRKILDQKKIRYQDASFKEYGYGATMVLLG